VRYRNLELLSPDVPVSAATSSSMRRKLSRCKERRAGASVQPLRLSPLPWTHSNSEPVPFNGAAAEPRGCLVQHSVRGTLGVVDKSGVEVQVQYP
jgi:hypothetical protein